MTEAGDGTGIENARSDVADALYEARRTGNELGPVDLATDIAGGLSVHLKVADRFQRAGQTIGGWKVGLTSGPSRDLMGPAVRPFGFVLSDQIFPSGSEVELDGIRNCHIEPELCVILRESLGGPDVTRDQVLGALRGVAAAFEINEFRLNPEARKQDALAVADGLAHWGMVVGAEVELAPELGSVVVELCCNDTVVSTQRAGESLQMDDPYSSVARLCVELSKHGRALEAGQPVICGAFVQLPVLVPGLWTARFSGVGDVVVRFASESNDPASMSDDPRISGYRGS